MKKNYSVETIPHGWCEIINYANLPCLHIDGTSKINLWCGRNYGPEIFYFDGKKAVYYKFKTKSFKFIFKALKSIAAYINDMPCNELISPERLFWAKVHELIKYDHLPKETLKLFGTGMNGSLKVYIKQRTDLEDLTAKDRQLYIVCIQLAVLLFIN